MCSANASLLIVSGSAKDAGANLCTDVGVRKSRNSWGDRVVKASMNARAVWQVLDVIMIAGRARVSLLIVSEVI